jgi:hypothetical protein
MKIGIDSYCYHRYFGEVYPFQGPVENDGLLMILLGAQLSFAWMAFLWKPVFCQVQRLGSGSG